MTDLTSECSRLSVEFSDSLQNERPQRQDEVEQYLSLDF